MDEANAEVINQGPILHSFPTRRSADLIAPSALSASGIGRTPERKETTRRRRRGKAVAYGASRRVRDGEEDKSWVKQRRGERSAHSPT